MACEYQSQKVVEFNFAICCNLVIDLAIIYLNISLIIRQLAELHVQLIPSFLKQKTNKQTLVRVTCHILLRNISVPIISTSF